MFAIRIIIVKILNFKLKWSEKYNARIYIYGKK